MFILDCKILIIYSHTIELIPALMQITNGGPLFMRGTFG